MTAYAIPMTTQELVLKVGEFTLTPGGRYRSEGLFSGEEYREVFVEPAIRSNPNKTVVIDLDDPQGFGSSFLEEVFGGAVRVFGPSVKLLPRASRHPSRVERANYYLERARHSRR